MPILSSDEALLVKEARRPRTCNLCGNLLDPIDYCAECFARPGGCSWHGRQYRRHHRQRYCDRGCRGRYWADRRRGKPRQRPAPCARTLTLPGL